MGAEHDNVSNEANIMVGVITSGPNFLQFSYHSTNEIFKQLFDEYYELKSHFMCLTNNETSKHAFLKYQHEILPGHVFSLNDQCQLLSTNKTVVACKRDDELLCKKLYCQQHDQIGCSKRGYEVMGVYYFHIFLTF